MSRWVIGTLCWQLYFTLPNSSIGIWDTYSDQFRILSSAGTTIQFNYVPGGGNYIVEEVIKADYHACEVTDPATRQNGPWVRKHVGNDIKVKYFVGRKRDCEAGNQKLEVVISHDCGTTSNLPSFAFYSSFKFLISNIMWYFDIFRECGLEIWHDTGRKLWVRGSW